MSVTENTVGISYKVMYQNHQYFPQDFAIAIAHQHGLSLAKHNGDALSIRSRGNNNSASEEEKQAAEQVRDELANLQTFQMLSLSSPYETASYLYRNEELNEAQITALKLIHEMTGAWAKGYITDKLMTRLESGDPKVTAQISELLIKVIDNEVDISDTNNLKGTMRTNVKEFWMELSGTTE